ncbi:MAG: biotin--[acetyl-CoA-carboxylase] ligase [Deltaproteobacteria bacterium]|nr:biotin--[acetyl-CoA-carboxylase] ligase [Deltaproteobacteria bacterium]MBN2845947.1 biotin--[acetyl-CoA-carboxylase] ligase [Deltaproteobacteria bacterium]
MIERENDSLENLVCKGLIGKKIHYLKEVDSTNSYAWKLASNGRSEGEVVIADSQSRGRGRKRHVWQSPPECNLYTSIILRPSIKPSLATQLTLMAGVAVAELLTQYCTDKVSLKWPNDVLVGGKKICGILTEMSIKRGAVDFVVIGIGININIRKTDFDQEYCQRATSLLEETAGQVSRVSFASALFRSFESWYTAYISEGFDVIKDRWTAFSGIVGKEIAVSDGNKTRRGTALGINDFGELVVIDTNERTHQILSGDVKTIGD